MKKSLKSASVGSTLTSPYEKNWFPSAKKHLHNNGGIKNSFLIARPPLGLELLWESAHKLTGFTISLSKMVFLINHFILYIPNSKYFTNL